MCGTSARSAAVRTLLLGISTNASMHAVIGRFCPYIGLQTKMSGLIGKLVEHAPVIRVAETRSFNKSRFKYFLEYHNENPALRVISYLCIESIICGKEPFSYRFNVIVRAWAISLDKK